MVVEGVQPELEVLWRVGARGEGVPAWPVLEVVTGTGVGVDAEAADGNGQLTACTGDKFPTGGEEIS
jgi:hypothetical protein